MRFPATRRTRDILGGGLFALALTLGGSGTCLADSPAKVDHYVSNPPPVYPDTAQFAGEQGDVLVDVQVTSFGYPRKIRVKQSSGFADLDNAATEAAASWHYVPAVIDGDTATAWTTVKIHFELPQPAPASQPGTPAPAQTH